MDCEEGCQDDCNPSPTSKDDLFKPPFLPCKPHLDPVPDWVAHVKRTEHTSTTFQNCGVLCFTILLLLLSLVSFMFCQECLFAILVVSACLCPFFHPLNAPLWLAILLLTIGGWSFTAGALEIRWNSRV